VNTLKHICQTLIQFVKQVGAFPQAIVHHLKERQQRTVIDEAEVERLDRIRNPWKYRGK